MAKNTVQYHLKRALRNLAVFIIPNWFVWLPVVRVKTVLKDTWVFVKPISYSRKLST